MSESSSLVYTTTSDASSATSGDSARQKTVPARQAVPKDPMGKKLHWSFMEAKIEFIHEKANLVREQVLTQKEITRGQLLKNRLMELEIEKIEGEKERAAKRNFDDRPEIIDIDPGICEEPPDKRHRKHLRGSATATVTIAPVAGASQYLGSLRSAIQQAQSSSARSSTATPQETIHAVREGSVVSDNLNSIVESINFYESSAPGFTGGQDSMDSSGYGLEKSKVTKMEPNDEFGMEYGDANVSSGYLDSQQYLQSLCYASSSAGPSLPNPSMDMDSHSWKVTQFEPFLNQTTAGAELVQVLAQGVSLTEKQRICLVRMLSGYLRNVCKNPARGPDVPERKQCVDMLFDAYPQLGIDSNKQQWIKKNGYLENRLFYLNKTSKIACYKHNLTPSN